MDPFCAPEEMKPDPENKLWGNSALLTYERKTLGSVTEPVQEDVWIVSDSEELRKMR